MVLPVCATLRTRPRRPSFASPHAGPGQRGFTLVEAMVCVAITGLLLATAAPGLAGLIDRQRLSGVAANLASDVQHARADAINGNEALRLSFYLAGAGSCYVVHTGAHDRCSCAAAGPALCTGGARQLKTVSLAAENRVAVRANVASILFDPLHGTGTPGGSIDITLPGGQAIRHIVNVMGRVRSCSPAVAAPAVTGFNVC